MWSFVFWFKFHSFVFSFFNFMVLLLILFVWWRDVRYESLSGEYSPVIIDGLKLGMLIFILREVCFFLAFFWTFFHSSFSPAGELGGLWPPFYLEVFNPFGGPLLNTLILLRSGVSVTWSHHGLVGNKSWKSSWVVTILLGAYFTFLQGLEYSLSSFSIRDSVYGSTFFIATGFHGIHVLVGSLFLLVCLLRASFSVFSTWHHLGIELAIWY